MEICCLDDSISCYINDNVIKQKSNCIASFLACVDLYGLLYINVLQTVQTSDYSHFYRLHENHHN